MFAPRVDLHWSFSVNGSPFSDGVPGRLDTCVSTRVASLYIQMHTTPELFSWDSQKSARTKLQRGFDFEFAAHIFEGATLDRTDTRRDYGEVRRIATGRCSGQLLTVVYTDRLVGEGVVERRIISARRSNDRERKAYKKTHSEG